MKMTALTPNLMVKDVNKTVAFYKDVLGFEVVMTVPETGKLDWAWMKRDEVNVMFQSRADMSQAIPALRNAPVGATMTLYVMMEGVADLFKQLKDHEKIRVVEPLHDMFYGTKEFTIRDENDYLLTFAERVS